MPVYVYRNLNTNETFEVEQRITEDAWTRHPESGDPVKRLIQPVGIAFKGSGFYVTDSRGNASAKANGASGEREATGSADAKASESAPATSEAGKGGSTGASPTKSAVSETNASKTRSSTASSSTD